MANALELGKILPKDERKSIQWCTKAAQQGYPEAEFQLSLWYLTGIPGFLEKSPDKSFYYALEAAKKGFAKAEFSVGHLKEYGIGTRADFAESIQWYKRAAAQDNTRAKLRLKELLE
jgi:TPR repeat protein